MRFVVFLIILGAIAAFSLTSFGAAVAILAGISFVGLPLFLAMAVIPTLFLVLLLAWLVRLLSRLFGGKLHWLICLAVAVGLLAIPPYLENKRLNGIAERLVADDHHSEKISGPFDTFAIVRYGHNRGVACGDLCQRMLLNGQAERVVIANSDLGSQALPHQLSGMEYSFEDLGSCAHTALLEGNGGFTVPGEGKGKSRTKPSDLIRQKMAEGFCLVGEPVPVARADAILVRNHLRRMPADREVGLRFQAETIGAHRLSLWVKDSNGFTEMYRKTGVRVDLLAPILAPTYAGGYGLELVPGFLRQPKFLGGVRQYAEAPPLEPVLYDVLDLKLSLETGGRDTETRRLISAALTKSSAPTPSEIDLIDHYFDGLNGSRKPEQQDVALALRLLQDDRFPAPNDIAAIVNAEVVTSEQIRLFAALLFRRLFETDVDARTSIPNLSGFRLSFVAGAISLLPDHAVAPYRKELEALARDRERRVRAASALVSLTHFGQDAVPTFLYLIEDAHRLKPDRGGARPEWRVPYLAGMGGLCRLGRSAEGALPVLYDYLGRGMIAQFGPYWSFTINTLVSMGADPEEIWSHVETGHRNHTRKHFDAVVGRAQSRLSCSL
ncbi:hypothetical protein [Hoeflea poritis]|uniref:Uncharacterized protein n=1 Tax=Hoeflea poritis TaxID=2993659 RepID=A0ABT4VNJ5_9HYPH|nr:hypothetical protein [Hoeflea poritis]MDA4845730.1 hypothetical protein [Hoeflea poritis]